MKIKGKNIQLFPLHCNSAFSRELNIKKQMESFHEGTISVTKASQRKNENEHIQSANESINQYVE